MSDIKSLSGRGRNISHGVGSLTRYAKRAVKYGNLNNLKDNLDSTLQVIGKYKEAIKYGRFNRLSQKRAWSMIKKEESEKGHSISKEDRKDIKAILKHMGEGRQTNSKVVPAHAPVDEAARTPGIARVSRITGKVESLSERRAIDSPLDLENDNYPGMSHPGALHSFNPAADSDNLGMSHPGAARISNPPLGNHNPPTSHGRIDLAI